MSAFWLQISHAQPLGNPASRAWIFRLRGSVWLTNQQLADHILQTICTYDENSNAVVLGRGRRGQRWVLRNPEREPSRLDDWLYVWGEGGGGREQSLEWLHGKQQLWNQVATTVERQAFGLGWSWGSIHRLCEASETSGLRSQVGRLTKEQVMGEAEWRQLSLYLKRWSGPISLEIPTWEAYWDEGQNVRAGEWWVVNINQETPPWQDGMQDQGEQKAGTAKITKRVC